MSQPPPRRAARVDDAVLVRAALGGDGRAATCIVERYAAVVRRCVRRSVAHADVDDHVQEVFLRCFQHLSRLRDGGSLRSFLIGIALRCAATERRRLRRGAREGVTRSGEIPERDFALPSFEQRQVAWRTSVLLRRLRPDVSRLLELRFIEEREIAEVASGMGCSRATVKRKLVRARARLYAAARTEPVILEYLDGHSLRPIRLRSLEMGT